MKNQAGIVGFRGYSGAELVGILTRHPSVEPVLLEHRSEGEPGTIPYSPEAVRHLSVVFLATPPEVSMEARTRDSECGR